MMGLGPGGHGDTGSPICMGVNYVGPLIQGSTSGGVLGV